jgi:HlyD family secretion protein
LLPTIPLVRASYEKYHPKKDVEMVVPYDLLLSARLHGRARRSDVRWINSGVQGQTTLLTIVPDGSVVKKGDVLVALDSSALSNQLINQQITTKSAEANFLNAKLARENADHTLTAYQNDLFPRDEREAKGEAEVAERELAVAQGQLELYGGRGLGDEQAKLNVKRYELDVARAKLALEKARNRLHILTQYTKHQQTLGLEMAVKKARSDELSKGATWELEKGKEQKLERMIAACTIVAPTDGTVVYSGRLEPGATIRERDSLMRIVPPPDADPDRR